MSGTPLHQNINATKPPWWSFDGSLRKDLPSGVHAAIVALIPIQQELVAENKDT
jgi:hypothetical protein